MVHLLNLWNTTSISRIVRPAFCPLFSGLGSPKFKFSNTAFLHFIGLLQQARGQSVQRRSTENSNVYLTDPFVPSVVNSRLFGILSSFQCFGFERSLPNSFRVENACCWLDSRLKTLQVKFLPKVRTPPT